MKKKHMVILLIFVFVLVIVLGIINFFLARRRKLEVLYLRYGDKINQVQVYDIEGNETTIQPTSEYTLLFYLSAYCGSCIEYLPEISLLQEVLQEEDVSVCIVWLEKPPRLQLSKNNLPEEINYSMGEKMKLDSATPTYYLIDKNGSVIFKDVVATNLMDKAAELGIFSRPTIKERLNTYLRSKYDNQSKQQPTMIFFSLEGCSDCAAAEEMIYNKKLDDMFIINHIYSYRDKAEPGDRFKIYQHVYEIAWYPSFLLLSDNDYFFVGQVPLEELENCLRDASVKMQ